MSDKTAEGVDQRGGNIAREMLDWPQGTFSVNDPEPGNHHSPIYLQFPNGLLVNLSCDDREGLDIARTAWIAERLNNALAAAPKAPTTPDLAVKELVEAARAVRGCVDWTAHRGWDGIPRDHLRRLSRALAALGGDQGSVDASDGEALTHGK